MINRTIFLIVIYNLITFSCLSQDLKQYNKLYACRIIRMLEIESAIYSVTPTNIYELKNEEWKKIHFNMNIGNIKKIQNYGDVLIALTSKGFYLGNAQNWVWEKIGNDAQLMLNGEALFSVDISNVFIKSNNFYLIGNHNILEFDTRNNKITKLCKLPYSLDRKSCLIGDSIYIYFNYDRAKNYCYNINSNKLKESNDYRELCFNYKYEIFKTNTFTYRFDFDKLIISDSLNNIISTEKLPYSLYFIKGIFEYNDNLIIGTSKQGIFLFNLKEKTLRRFNDGITEGWFTEFIVKDSLFCAIQPDNNPLFSVNYGKTWKSINIKKWGYIPNSVNIFNNKIILSAHNFLIDVINDSIISKFDEPIEKFLTYNKTLVVLLSTNKIKYSNNLSEWYEIDLNRFDQLKFEDIFCYKNNLYLVSNSNKSYKIKSLEILGNNINESIMYEQVISDTINIFEKGVSKQVKVGRYWKKKIYSKEIFLLDKNGRLIYSNNGIDYQLLLKDDRILTFDYDKGLLFISFKENGIKVMKIDSN